MTEIEERGGEAAAGQAAEQDLEVAIARGLLDQARAQGHRRVTEELAA